MATLPGYAWRAREDDHIPGLDPVGAWLLGGGLDFEAAAIDRDCDGDRDFRTLAAIDEAADPIEAIRKGAFVRVVAGDTGAGLAALKAKLATDAACAENEGLRYFALPLRERSFRDEAQLKAPIGDAKWSAPKGLKGKTLVVTGIIDHGINIAHARFRHAKRGPRVDFAWIQGAPADASKKASTVPFGREWTAPGIADALEKAEGDEGRALRLLDLVDFRRAGRDPLSNPMSHGTHVLDLAAGAASDDDDAVANRIIAVDLPERVIEDTSGGLIALCFIQALDYILRRARTISVAHKKAVPVVLNFSLSRAGGPEGGLHIAARAMEALIKAHQAEIEALGLTVVAPDADGKARVEIVLPSGNRRQARGHATAAAAAKGKTSLTVPWRVQPGDMTSSYLEFWLPADATSVSLRIAGPGGTAETVPLALDVPQTLEGDGHVIAQASLDTREGGAQRIFIALAPTDAGQSGRRPAPSGVWQVSVSATLRVGGRIDAHVLRDDTALGFAPRGRQSYFDDPAYARFGADGDGLDGDPAGLPSVVPSVVRRDGAFNGLAGGESPVVVSGYRVREVSHGVARSADWPSAYAGAPSRDSARKLTAAAPSDRSRLLSGVFAAGTLSGTTVAMNGTSVAAPQLSRAIAQALMNGATPHGEARWDELLEAHDDTDEARLGRGLLPARVQPDAPSAA
ncbi:MAG: hypothetical protein AAF968_08245 [Pseudomonadota bacterium]